MEIYKDGIYWYIRSPYDHIPKELDGMWTSKEAADRAIEMFRASIKAKTMNVSERHRRRRHGAANNPTISS